MKCVTNMGLLCGALLQIVWGSSVDYMSSFQNYMGPFYGALLRIVWGSFADYVELFCGDLTTYLQASSFLKAHPLRSSVRSICGLGCMVLSVRSRLSVWSHLSVGSRLCET